MVQLVINFFKALLNFKENPKMAGHTALLLIILGVNYLLSHFTNFAIDLDTITGISGLYEFIIGTLVTWIGMAIAFFSRNVKKLD